jgi:hypothetical protein
MKKILSIFIALACTLAFMTGASGQSSTPAIPDSAVLDRTLEIQKLFDDTRFSNSLWWYGWMGVYGAATAASFTIGGLAKNDVTRITWMVSGVESVFGLVGVFLSPMPPAYAKCRLDSMPSATPEERLKKLSRAEGYLRETAENQDFGQTWITHGLNFVVNGAGGLVIWKGYEKRIERAGGKPWQEGLMNFLIGFVVGELQIFTQPTRGIEQWKAYKAKYGIKDDEPGSNVKAFVLPSDTGLAAGLTLAF